MLSSFTEFSRKLSKLVYPFAIVGSVVASGNAQAALGSGTFYSIKVPTDTTTPFELVTYISNGSSVNATFSTNGSIKCNNCTLPTATPAVPPGRVNAISFDGSQKTVFFFDNTTAGTVKLNYVNVSSATPVWGSIGNVSTPGFTATGTVYPSGSAFFGDSIYATVNNSNRLIQYKIVYSGGLPSVQSATDFTLPKSYTYGDIAIGSDGTLYGYTAGTQEFFRAKLNDIANTFVSNTVSVPSGTVPSLQIAFGPDGTLYGAGTSDGNLYEINPTSGTPTLLTNINFIGGTNSNITDFASAAPVPGPMPLLGAVAAFGASRKLRRRITASRTNLVNS